jgi:preprotein translocase subunit SecG
MLSFITVVHVITCVLLVLVILLQSGKGAEISASFSGSSQTVFGSSGGANFFTRFTQVAAAIFFATSLGLTVIANRAHKSRFDSGVIPAAAPAAQTAPVDPAPAPTAMGEGTTTAPADTAPVPAKVAKDPKAQQKPAR